MTIGELKKFVENDKNAESKLRSLACSLAKTQYIHMGWNTKSDETDTDTKLRGTIIGLMLYGEDSDVITTAINLYDSTTLDNLTPELRGLILIAAVRHKNDNSTVDLLLETYKTSDSAELKQDICIGLTATRDTDTITRLLGLLKDTSLIRTQDTSRWIIYLIRNQYARNQTWQWIRNNWDWIMTTFKDDKSYDDYPRYVATALSTNAQLDEYRDFFMPLQSDPTLSRVIEMGINEISNRVNMIERDGSSVRDALQNF